MKIYTIAIFLLLIPIVLSGCATKELTTEEQYQKGIEQYSNLELDDARETFILLKDYKNSSIYFYQIVTLQSILHLDRIENLYIQDDKTTALIYLKNGDVYYYELTGAETVRKLLIKKGNN